MKKRILNFIIRIIRLFHKESTMMPELSTIPEGQVKIGQLYTHYGRVVAAKPNPLEAYFRYYVDGKTVSEIAYNEALLQGKECSIDRINAACHCCDFHRYGLPCRCDFNVGSNQGYWTILSCSKQFSNNPII